ncbi:fluoride efflux transporter FluC [Streptomyces thermolineatus]|uniref:fluoride efflux transporter FluC n=1 Tax=Streptomyces thermolineatus TaxID=44033 RepID=UPI003CD0B4AA
MRTPPPPRPQQSGREGPNGPGRPGRPGRPNGPDVVSGEPVDPDVDLHLPQQRAELTAHPFAVLGAVAAGGALGAAARHGAALLWPVPAGAFPWSTLGVNAVGSGLIGVLMVLVAERGAGHPLVRPFLGTGVLGGFTTFSAYAADVAGLLTRGDAAAALGYAAATLAAALGAVWAAAAATRRLVRRTAPPAPSGRRGDAR